MKREILDTITGIFVLTVLVFLAYYSINLGRMNLFGGDYYQVNAEFDSVAGLKNGANVEIAGVNVGKVDDITLDSKSDMARVRLAIKNGIKLQEDVIASIRTKGIIGDKFISISPGGSAKAIPPGGMIEDTGSSVDFMQLLTQFIQKKSSPGKNAPASGRKVLQFGG